MAVNNRSQWSPAFRAGKRGQLYWVSGSSRYCRNGAQLLELGKASRSTRPRHPTTSRNGAQLLELGKALPRRCLYATSARSQWSPAFRAGKRHKSLLTGSPWYCRNGAQLLELGKAVLVTDNPNHRMQSQWSPAFRAGKSGVGY